MPSPGWFEFVIHNNKFGIMAPLRPVPVITTIPTDDPPVPTNINVPKLALCLPIQNILKVYDGDTATKVLIALEVSVRYNSCWAPELDEPFGPESRDRAKQAEGKSGRLYIDLTDVRNMSDLLTLGRVVGEIWLNGETESESQKQIRLKMASTTKGGVLGQ
jgi:endonuclease YncB( thermonuclease family)